MTSDDLFARVEHAIIDSRLLRDERPILEQACANARQALRSAILEMAELRAAICEDRRRREARGYEPGLPTHSERLEWIKDYIRSRQELLGALRDKTLN
jgi:hypothetical protein